jgi:phosphate transport system protein
VDDAIAAYADEDVEACFAIDTWDDEIDAMYKEASGAAVRDLVESEIEEGTSGQDIEKLISEVSRLRLPSAASNASATTPSVSPRARCTTVENGDELLGALRLADAA